MRSTVFAFAILAGLFFACRTEARATLRVCDTTNEPVNVAIAALTPAANGIEAQSEGWFKIDSGMCQLVIDTDLDPGTAYYLFAKARTIAWAGKPGKATKDATFCANDAGKFTYVDRQSDLCTGAADQMLWFINEPIGGTDWTITLDTPT